MDRPGEVRQPRLVHPSGSPAGPRGIERATGDAPDVPARFPAFGMTKVAAISGDPAAAAASALGMHP